MERIPINNEWGGNWLDYNGQVFLILFDGTKGNTANFQYDGTSCFQGSVCGVVACKFTTKSKWFSPTFWYKKTCWGTEHPSKLYFDTKKVVKLFDHFEATVKNTKVTNKEWDAMWAKVNAEADKYARPSSKILAAILREAKKHSGMNLKFIDADETYGRFWWEARVPVLDDEGKLYLLTWQNCD